MMMSELKLRPPENPRHCSGRSTYVEHRAWTCQERPQGPQSAAGGLGHPELQQLRKSKCHTDS